MPNPKYVRLADHMVNGCCVDMESGFSISGYDVQPFPEEDRDASRFVRRKINAGVLEPAGQAEYDEAHPEEEEDENASAARDFVAAVKAVDAKAPSQEHLVRQKHGDRLSRIKAARASANDEDDDYERESARREALINEADEGDLNTDDPEQQRENTATRPAQTAKKTAGATKKAGGRRRAAASEDGGE